MFSEPWKRRVMARVLSGETVEGCRPETSLHRAILETAIHDFVRGRDLSREEMQARSGEFRADYRSAKQWLFFKSKDDLLSSAVPFHAVCLLLGVSPPEVRRLCQELTSAELHLWLKAKSHLGRTGTSEQEEDEE